MGPLWAALRGPHGLPTCMGPRHFGHGLDTGPNWCTVCTDYVFCIKKKVRVVFM